MTTKKSVKRKPSSRKTVKTSPPAKAKAAAGAPAKKAAPKKTKSSYELKTKANASSVDAFIASIDNEARRKDAAALLALFKRVTKAEPKMWGPSIIGYGKYAYAYDSGHSGEMCATGFSPRKGASVLYVMPGFSAIAPKLARLGKHKTGGSCLYVNKLADIDMAVLEEIVRDAWATMKAKYGKLA